MAISRVKTWSSGEVLTASDLNAEFNNVLNNAADLVSPFTKAISMGGFALNFDAANSIAMVSTTGGVVLSGGTIREPAEDTITAFATSGQTNATALAVAKKYHRISVCATAADSVKLPTSTAGQAHFIRNDGAAAAQVFGTSSDTINGVATATGLALPAGMGAWYVCTTAGNWTTTLVSVQNVTTVTSVAGTNTITATAAIPPGAYVVGQVFEGIAANTNTAAATFNVSSLGAGAIQVAGAALAGGEILQNAPFRVFVSATTPVFQLIANGQVAPFLDTNALVKGSSDGTKKIRIEADGITTGTTRVITMPDSDVFLAGLSSATQSANTVYAGPTSGGAAAPAFRALVGADGIALTLIATQAASTSSTIDFATGITSTYDEYLFVLTDIIPATDNVSLVLRISEDGGSTYKAVGGNYAYTLITQTDAGAAPTGSGDVTTATFVKIATNLGNTGTKTFSSEVRFWNPAGTSKMKQFKFESTLSPSGATQSYQSGSGQYSATANAVNAIRFLMSTGNITSGNFALYGVRKT